LHHTIVSWSLTTPFGGFGAGSGAVKAKLAADDDGRPQSSADGPGSPLAAMADVLHPKEAKSKPAVSARDANRGPWSHLPAGCSTLYGCSLMKQSGLQEVDFTAHGCAKPKGRRMSIAVTNALGAAPFY
jgi:hypothetical protein